MSTELDALRLELAELSNRMGRVAELLGRMSGESRNGALSLATGSDGRLLDASEVASMLKLKVSTVRAYAEKGSLPCVRLGGRLRFRPSDVGAWIAARRTKGGR